MPLSRLARNFSNITLNGFVGVVAENHRKRDVRSKTFASFSALPLGLY
jgi:hypothetical protein